MSGIRHSFRFEAFVQMPDRRIIEKGNRYIIETEVDVASHTVLLGRMQTHHDGQGRNQACGAVNQ